MNHVLLLDAILCYDHNMLDIKAVSFSVLVIVLGNAIYLDI